jgi:hypothetical protein
MALSAPRMSFRLPSVRGVTPSATLRLRCAMLLCRACLANSVRTAENSSVRYSQGDGRCGRHLENHMLLIVGAVIVLIAVVIIPRMGVPGSMNGSTLGWMSEHWLAEHRAAHSA